MLGDGGSLLGLSRFPDCNETETDDRDVLALYKGTQTARHLLHDLSLALVLPPNYLPSLRNADTIRTIG